MRWVSLLLGIKHTHKKKKNMDYLRSSVPIFVSAFVNSNFDINFEIPLALPIEVIYPRKFSKVDAHQWENTVAGLRSRQRREAAKKRRGRQEEQAASQSFSDQAFDCPKYSRVYAPRIRLGSQQRECNKKKLTTSRPKIIVLEESAIHSWHIFKS